MARRDADREATLEEVSHDPAAQKAGTTEHDDLSEIRHCADSLVRFCSTVSSKSKCQFSL